MCLPVFTYYTVQHQIILFKTNRCAKRNMYKKNNNTIIINIYIAWIFGKPYAFTIIKYWYLLRTTSVWRVFMRRSRYGSQFSCKVAISVYLKVVLCSNWTMECWQIMPGSLHDVVISNKSFWFLFILYYFLQLLALSTRKFFYMQSADSKNDWCVLPTRKH